jgi:hypothetical protein
VSLSFSICFRLTNAAVVLVDVRFLLHIVLDFHLINILWVSWLVSCGASFCRFVWILMYFS